jgi:acyl carrier protein
MANRDPAAQEALVLNVYREVFGTSSVHADDDFLELGGDSLMAAEICVRIEDATANEVPLVMIFEAPSPRKLAARLQDDHESIERGSRVP